MLLTLLRNSGAGAAYLASVAETVTLSEALSSSATLTANLSELVTLSEALSANLAFSASVSETVTLSEALAASAALHTALAETVTLAEALASSAGLSTGLAETVALAEQLDTTAAYLAALVDTLLLADGVSGTQGTSGGSAYTANVAEAISLAEQIDVALFSLRNTTTTVLPAVFDPYGVKLSRVAARIVQSATWRLLVNLTDAVGSPITDGILTFQLYAFYGDTTSVLLKKTASVSGGLAFAAVDTSGLAPGYFKYDVTFTGTAGTGTVIQLSPLYLEPSAVKLQSSYPVSLVPTIANTTAVFTYSLAGVLDNGMARGVGVPWSSQRTVIVTRGALTEVAVRLNVTAEFPTAEFLSGGVLVLTLKKKPQDSSPIYQQIAAVVAGGGETQFIIPASIFVAMTVGQYVYDVWFVDGLGTVCPVVPLSTLLLK